MKFERPGDSLLEKVQVRHEVRELERALVCIILLVNSERMRRISLNDAVVDLNEWQLNDGLTDLLYRLSVQRDMFILVLHVTLHGRQQFRVSNRPGRKVVVGPVRKLFAV